MISIFDYGAGNLQSVENALHAIGAQHRIIRTAVELQHADRLILPGVGHFGQMMHAIDRLEARAALVSRIRDGVPFLGICLGLQALFMSSEEAPGTRGLGIFEGTVRRFQGTMRVPHMGWNNIRALRASKLLQDASDEPYVYFANSYYASLGSETSAVCEYECEFAAIIESNNVAAVQFHPEKSGTTGLQILKNFACL